MKTVEYDNALNEAGWVMYMALSKVSPLDGAHFNAMKPCLKEAIEAYLNHEENQRLKEAAK